MKKVNTKYWWGAVVAIVVILVVMFYSCSAKAEFILTPDGCGTSAALAGYVARHKADMSKEDAVKDFVAKVNEGDADGLFARVIAKGDKQEVLVFWQGIIGAVYASDKITLDSAEKFAAHVHHECIERQGRIAMGVTQ